MKFKVDIFNKLNSEWALLTAGDQKKFNTMTISWGEMGTLWNKPVVTAYVRESRYTHEFLDHGDYFTISFYPEDYKKVLGVLGSKSGRDMDKMTESGLKAKFLEKGVTFEEAEITLVCKKLFMQRIDMDLMSDEIRAQFYADNDAHDMYIGEVIDIIQ
ncbi:MAG: flavin reductase [Eubacterium sp.]|nr:flavin reductase [Eubacterium sp.]